jgi:hypothetical protein
MPARPGHFRNSAGLTTPASISFSRLMKISLASALIKLEKLNQPSSVIFYFPWTDSLGTEKTGQAACFAIRGHGVPEIIDYMSKRIVNICNFC